MYYSSDEPARGLLGDECQSQCFTETWSVELKTEASIKRRLVTQIRHDLPPLLSRILCSSFPFVDDLFSVFFQEPLYISFSRCSSLDIRLFTFAFYCSLSCSSRRILLILASFLPFLSDFRFTPFTCCFLWSLCLLISSLFSLKTLSPLTRIITISSGWQSLNSAVIVALRVV